MCVSRSLLRAIISWKWHNVKPSGEKDVGRIVEDERFLECARKCTPLSSGEGMHLCVSMIASHNAHAHSIVCVHGSQEGISFDVHTLCCNSRIIIIALANVIRDDGKIFSRRVEHESRRLIHSVRKPFATLGACKVLHLPFLPALFQRTL